MKNVCLLETAFALRTVDNFLGAVALKPKIDSYDELRSLIRNKINPLPGALSTLIKYHGKYTDYDPFDPVTKYKDVGLHGKLIANIDYIGRRSPKEMVTITHMTRFVQIAAPLIEKFADSVR